MDPGGVKTNSVKTKAIFKFGGALVLATSTAPLERVQIVLQTQGELQRQGLLNKPIRGVFKCGATIFRNEGGWGQRRRDELAQ